LLGNGSGGNVNGIVDLLLHPNSLDREMSAKNQA
jgi:hypothetical protein